MNRLEQQLEFIKEIDKLKSIIRRSLLIDGSRYENSAEHSWHFAVMALILKEYYPHSDQLDMTKVIKMALVHDLAEIYAGDTYCYDNSMSETQADRELSAMQKLISILPPDQQIEFFELWQEFEAGLSHESAFARVIDRLNPFMLNFYSGGVSWVHHKVKKSQVLKRMGEIKESCPAIWTYVNNLLSQAISNGFIIDDINKMHEHNQNASL